MFLANSSPISSSWNEWNGTPFYLTVKASQPGPQFFSTNCSVFWQLYKVGELAKFVFSQALGRGLFSLGIKTFYTQRNQRLKMICYSMIRSRSIMNQFNVAFDWKFTLSLTPSLIVDRFQTNNTLIYSHGLLYNVAWYKHLHAFWFSSYLHSCRPREYKCSFYCRSCVRPVLSEEGLSAVVTV